jgi:hypothetical protein
MPYPSQEFLEKGRDERRELVEIPKEDTNSPDADSALNNQRIQLLGNSQFHLHD